MKTISERAQPLSSKDQWSVAVLDAWRQKLNLEIECRRLFGEKVTVP